MCAGMQDGEGEKQKSYLARCRLPCPVTDAMLAQLGSMKNVVLQQTTPARVEHRRAMLVMPLPVFQICCCQHLMHKELWDQGSLCPVGFMHLWPMLCSGLREAW